MCLWTAESSWSSNTALFSHKSFFSAKGWQPCRKNFCHLDWHRIMTDHVKDMLSALSYGSVMIYFHILSTLEIIELCLLLFLQCYYFCKGESWRLIVGTWKSFALTTSAVFLQFWNAFVICSGVTCIKSHQKPLLLFKHHKFYPSDFLTMFSSVEIAILCKIVSVQNHQQKLHLLSKKS